MHQLDPQDAQHLGAYVERFLQGSYNVLMTGLQKDLDPGLNISRLSNESFLRFFKLASFFTRYVRLQQVQPPLSEPTSQANGYSLMWSSSFDQNDHDVESTCFGAGGQAEVQGLYGKQRHTHRGRGIPIWDRHCHFGLGDLQASPFHMANSHRAAFSGRE